jgi:hypothetical protein
MYVMKNVAFMGIDSPIVSGILVTTKVDENFRQVFHPLL